jgi:RHS repeat-associated protein
MKKFSNFCITVFLASIASFCQGQTTANVQTQQTSVPAPTPYAIVSRDANSQVWQSTVYEQGLSGQVVTHNQQYTELASGLNYKDPATDQWVPSQEVINILPDGSGAATNGQHQAYFPGNIYNGVITLITPDGTQLQSRPIGLSYSDGTNTVLIAALTNSVGELISSNQVLYPDAFVGVKADLLYTYTIGGFEQDIIIQEQPPTPEDFNLNSANCWLQMMTEFFDAPEPTVDGDSDDWLGFGTMEMVPGKAFLLGTNEQDNGIKVDKSWVNVSGRQILVEQVPVMALADELSQLPAPQITTTKVNSGPPLNIVSVKRLLPEPRPIQTRHQPLLVSKTEPLSKGVVLDYVTLNSQSVGSQPFTFQGDTTYYISGNISISGTGGIVVEGGAVIKYANNVALTIQYNETNVITPTNAYRPAIFTSMNDNSVGDPISGSTGNPTNTGANYLNMPFKNISTNATLSNLRFSYAGTAIVQSSQGSSYSASYPVWNCQFINCGAAVSLIDYDGENQLTLKLYNVLFSNCGTVLTNGDVSNDGEIKLAGQNITVDNANVLVGTWYNSYEEEEDYLASTSTLTNSILTGVQYQIYYVGPGEHGTGYLHYTNACYYGSSTGIYQSVGAGNYYLATNSPCRNVGTTTISPALLAELQQRTTWAPVVYASTNISFLGTLSPDVPRDTNATPDLGYHYDPLDYIFGGCNLSNSLTFTANTAVGWYETNGTLSAPYAISLTNGGSLSFSGNATEPDYFARYAMVQEEWDGNWTNAGLGGIIINGSGQTPLPQLSGFFTKWTTDARINIFSDGSAYGFIGFLNCEFYDAGLFSSLPAIAFTNCLFFRDLTAFSDTYTNDGFDLNNCTFYNGGASMARTNKYPVSSWQVENSSFDGTCFTWQDNWNGTNDTLFNYNAYNTNNFSWTNYAYLSPLTNGFLETNGMSDQMVTNFNWESSWFGNFYLPTNSPLLGMGSTNANLLGLYHFTTQTNQTVQGTNKVDIGYHYVATGTNGIPISTPGDGIPDYIADANGNGIDDSGETPWDIGILSQPETTNVAQGQRAIFSVTVGGIGPFTYQWLLNSNAISGATLSNYTNLVVQSTQDGSLYSVIARNSDGSVTSSVTILGVEVPFNITNLTPQSLTVTQGANVSFYVGASGNYLSYQWSTNGVSIGNGPRISGATNNTLAILNAQVWDANTYTVVVTNLFGIMSTQAVLIVVTNPVITAISPNTNAIQSEDVTFSVSASGETSYQWWFSNSVTNASIPYANGSSYTRLVVQPTNDGLYSVVVTNIAGSTNDGATLNVLVPPWITQQPTNLTVNQGSSATFSITAIGTANVGYQWFENSTNLISGATTNPFTLSSVQGSYAGGYSCLVTNIAGTNMSARAWLSVNIGGGIITNGWGGTNGTLSLPILGTFVSMISPTNASPTNPFIFSDANLPISIRATASSAYGYITNVAFYFTGTNSGPTSFKLAGNAVPGPNIGSNTVFALVWTNASPGTNILEAVAQDYDGQSSTSSLAYVIMTVPPGFIPAPSMTLVWTEGAASTNVILSATVTNDGQPFSFVTNSNWTVTGGNGQYMIISPSNSLSTTVTFSTNGTYSLQLEVDNGYATNIQPTTIKIIRHPQINFISPTNNEAFLTNTPIVLSVTTTPYDGTITGVTFSTNSAFLTNGIQSVNSTWTYLWTNAPLWTNIISAVAYCSDGLTSTDTITNLVIPPLAVWFLAPTNNQLFIISPTNILLTAYPTDYVGSMVASVEFTNQTQSVSLGEGIEQTDGTYQLWWGDVTNGTNSIVVTATDSAGNIAMNTVTIIVNAMPVVNIVSPANSQIFVSVTNVILKATATDSDDGIFSVQFYATNLDAGNLLGTATNVGGGTNDFTWTSLVAGTYPVLAVATDNRGASTVSGIMVFQVVSTNGPPFVEITNPPYNETFPDGADIIITAEATTTNYQATITNVEFFVNGQSIGNAPNPPYEITECCLEPGTYQLAALATDSTGSSAISTNVQITVAQEVPVGQSFWDATFYPFSTGLWPLGNWDSWNNIYTGPMPTDPYGNIAIPITCESAVVYGSDYYCAIEDLPDDYPYASTSSLYKWDGTNWTRWGTLGDNNQCTNALPFYYVTAVAVDAKNIYVGGLVGGDYYNWNTYNVVQVNGTNITQLGGTFTNAWTEPTGNWDDGDSQQLYFKHPQLKIVNDNLYLYGDLCGTNGSTNIQFLAEWNPGLTNWEPVGPALNGVVYDIASLEGNLVVGGIFTNADGNPYANGVAELQNGNWTNLGSGISGGDSLGYGVGIPGVVFSIAACGSKLFVGGDFTVAGDQTNVNSVAVWDGADWQGIAGGLSLAPTPSSPYPPSGVFCDAAFTNPVVYSVATHGDSTLYIGGVFTGAGNSDGSTVPTACVAQANWNEQGQQWTWFPMDLGIYSWIPGLTFVDILPPGVTTVSVLNGTNSGEYDVAVGGLWANEPADNFLTGQQESVGTSTLPFAGLARWRVGYSLPPGAPTIVITNPPNNAVITNPDSVTIYASASSYTNIDEVEFFDDGTDIGSVTNAPYEISASLPYGQSELTAEAIDAKGVEGFSQPIFVNAPYPAGTVSTTDATYTVYANGPPVTLNVLSNDSTTTTNPLRIIQVSFIPTISAGQIGTVQINYNSTAVIYTPNANEYGISSFIYVVTDGISTNSALVTVNVISNPNIQIFSPTDGEQINETSGVVATTITGFADEYGGTITNVSLYVNGTLFAETNTPNFNFNWSTNSDGIDTFVAVAFDTSGFTNASAPVTIIPITSSSSSSGVIATISNLPATTRLGQPYPTVTTGYFDLRGTAEVTNASGSLPVAYQLLLCDQYGNTVANITPQADSGGFHEGGDNGGDLGTLDFSTIQNGFYNLVLSVIGGGKATNAPPVGIILDTPMKVGQFTFSEQDLNLPVSGIPITVTRTYNSQNPNSADFGYGWTFAMNSMNVQLDEQRETLTIGNGGAPWSGGGNTSGNGLGQTISVRTGGGYDVTLTLPNGQQATFYSSVMSGIPGYGLDTLKWNAPPWVHATLTAMDQLDGENGTPYAAVINGYSSPLFYSWWELPGVPLENQDLRGWVLTTQPDGTQYYLTRGNSTNVDIPDPFESGVYISATVYGSPTLSRIVESSTNQIIINPNSIYHLDPDGNTNDVVTISRDGQGRITAISDPDATNGLPLVQYVYDQDNGNLIQVLKLQNRSTGLYATNRYNYFNPNFPHLITSIENAEGVPVTLNYYDSSGRLTQTVDALGNTNQFIYDATNMEMVIDPLGRTNIYAYDAMGNVVAQTNALDQATLMAYDGFNDKTNQITFHNGQAYTNSYVYDPQGLGLLLSSTDPLGDTNAFTYNGLGEASSSTDARGNTTSNFYDGGGELTETIDALTNTTVNSYNDGLLVSSTDPVGTITTNSYDTSGNLISSASFRSSSGVILSSNTYTYDADNNRITSTVWRHAGGNWTNATTTYNYDAQNRVIGTINPDGGTNATVYNLIGQQAETIDPLGHVTSYVYDALGHLIETTNADGTTTTSAYDAVGNRTNSIDQLGRTNTYVFDGLNRLVETGYPDGTTNATVYDDVGRVSQMIDARGTITTNAYDSAGRRTAVINAFGTGVANTNFYSYDPNGNQITFTNANGHKTTYVYDPLNRQVQVQYPDGTTTETVYDSDGRSVSQTNQDGIAIWFAYDGAGRLIAVTNALQQVTHYQYDEGGNETAQIDALGRTNFYFYDGQGRRISHMMPGGQSEGFSYDPDGNQLYETNFNGVIITNQYDEMNRLIDVSSLYGYDVSFAYSVTGQRTNMVDPSGAYTYAYDLRDRLLQKTVNWNNGPSNSLNYAYDPNGNVTNISSGTPNGVNLIYAYDPLNRLTNVLANGNATAGYAYDLVGNLQTMRYGNGVTNQYQYDSMNRLTNLTWNSNITSLASFSYQLGSTGNRTNLNEAVNGTTRNYQWQYDNLYRLTNEIFNASSNIVNGYDVVGNRTSRTSHIGALTNQVFSFNTNDWLSTDKYDNNGNTTNSGIVLYQYDVMNHLTNAAGILMTYDGDGNRISKKSGSTTTYYLTDDQNPSGYAQVLEEWTVASSTNLSKVYNYGLGLISQRQPGTSTNYFIYDGHGSTRMLMDIGGNIVNVMAYDAFGNLIATNGVLQTGYLYSGQQYDFDLGLYYNRARLLNPNTGRFWTQDITDGNNEDPLSLHKYLYAADDPVNLDDPSGNDYGDFSINLSTIFLPFLKTPMLAGAIINATGTSAFNPTSALPIRQVGDGEIDYQLNKCYQKIQHYAEKYGPIPTETWSDWEGLMLTLDTRYFFESQYRYQYIGSEHPLLENRTFINSDLNYIGVGTGFAARLDNPAQMVFWTEGWLHYIHHVDPSSNTWAAEKTGYDAFNKKYNNN